MTADFAGTVALVTGAGRRLGFAIVRALHESGAAVALNDRTSEAVEIALARLGGGDRLCAAPADLAAPDRPALAVEQAAAGTLISPLPGGGYCRAENEAIRIGNFS